MPDSYDPKAATALPVEAAGVAIEVVALATPLSEAGVPASLPPMQPTCMPPPNAINLDA